MTKGELKQYRILEKEMQELENECLYWRTKAMKCTKALSISPIRGGNHDPYPTIVDKLTEVEELLRSKIEGLAYLRKRIEEAINGLDSLERHLMRLRYIKGWEWVKISIEVGYEWAQIHRLHNKALDKMIRNDTECMIK